MYISRGLAAADALRCCATRRCSLGECRLRQRQRQRSGHGEHRQPFIKLRVLRENIRKPPLSHILSNKLVQQHDLRSLCHISIVNLPESGVLLLLCSAWLRTRHMGVACPDETAVAAHSPGLCSFFVVEGTRSCHEISGRVEM